MDTQYNVYFAGDLQPGKSPEEVRAGLRTLFKADDSTLNKLLSGKPQLIKRACNKATALKYKRALEGAGAQAVIKRLRNTAAAVDARPESQAPQTPQPATPTLAERIAALTADDSVSARFSSGPPSAQVTEEPGDSEDELNAMAALLNAKNTSAPETTAPEDASAYLAEQTAEITVAEPGAPLLPPDYDNGAAASSAPDISHLSMGAVGDDIPTLADHREWQNPDISAISLAPEGSDFSDCASATPPQPELDLSAMQLAPAGSEILEQRYRVPAEAVTVDISQLSVEPSP